MWILQAERVNILFLSFVSNHWRKSLFPLAAVAAIIAFLFIPRGQADDDFVDLSEQIPFPELIEDDIEEELLPKIIIVDVKGAVQHPGVYSLDEGDRLIDAIHAAGGYLPEADTRQVNHAMKLSDEQLIYIPAEGEEMPDQETAPGNLTGSAGSSDGIVNINTASESELMTISGIGPSKAQAIIQYREENGSFQTLEELMNVSGIGQKTFEKLQHQIKIK